MSAHDIAPVVGRVYVCRNTAPPGWAGERVTVTAVADTGQRTARVVETAPMHPPAYDTVVSWDDLVLDLAYKPEPRS